MAICLAQQYKFRMLCTRQFQNRISDSVYTLLKIQAERFGIIEQFDFLESMIRHKHTGTEFLFYGLARNIREIKSLESIDIAWHEECELMTEEQWKIIDPTLRKEGSQHWLIFNPRFANDFVYRRFVTNPPEKTIIRKINYDENPFLSQTMIDVIEGAKKEDYSAFEHVYLGVPLTDDERSIIKPSWIEAAIDAHIKLGFEPDGENIIGFDVADSGEDMCANIHAHGSVVLWGEEWKGREDELLKSCSRTYSNADERGANIRYDCIGVGASAGAKFDELNDAQGKKIRYTKFNAGDSVFNPEGFYTKDRVDRIRNKDYFSNLKAQAWWMVGDRFRNTYEAIVHGIPHKPEEMISLSSKIPARVLQKLKDELATPRRDFDANGRVKVESKKDLDKRDIPSPNIADALIICYSPNRRVTSFDIL